MSCILERHFKSYGLEGLVLKKEKVFIYSNENIIEKKVYMLLSLKRDRKLWTFFFSFLYKTYVFFLIFFFLICFVTNMVRRNGPFVVLIIVITWVQTMRTRRRHWLDRIYSVFFTTQPSDYFLFSPKNMFFFIIFYPGPSKY